MSTGAALVPGANPYYPAQLDFTAASALYLYVETVGAPPGAGTNASRVTLPLNPDSDGEGLRDGQEAAGWRVLVWREITMEAMANYSVTSNPLVADGDLDGNSDFVEFQNGSDAPAAGLHAC